MQETINTIIVDDEPDAIDIISILCERHALKLQVDDTCQSINSAVESIKDNDPDLVFLDIQFSEGTGFDILKAFPTPRFQTIFVSAFDHYAMEILKLHAFDYLLKPVDENEFNKTLNQLANRLHYRPKNEHHQLTELSHILESQKIGVPTAFGIDYYQIKDIVRLKADGSYTIMHFRSGNQITVCRRLKDFDDRLSRKAFLRLHRGHIVNIKYIKSFHRDEGGFITMCNGAKVPIARGKREEVIKVLSHQSYVI